jgi:hypothetical protein
MITNDAAKASESKEIQRLKVLTAVCFHCSITHDFPSATSSALCFVSHSRRLLQDIIAKLKAGQAVELDDHWTASGLCFSNAVTTSDGVVHGWQLRKSTRLLRTAVSYLPLVKHSLRARLNVALAASEVKIVSLLGGGHRDRRASASAASCTINVTTKARSQIK